MTGYAVTARIGDARPVRLGRPCARPMIAAEPWPELVAAVIEPLPERDAPTVRSRLTAWWSTLSIDWLETTFYLFDPNSWR